MGKSYNSALLKLELLSRGIQIDPKVKTELGGKFKEPLWTRTGPTSTGIDMILEKKVYVSAPLGGPTFSPYEDTPFLLTLIDEQTVITKNGEVAQKVRVFPRPSFYDRKTSDGIPMQRIGTICGDFIAIALDNRCWFWGYYRGEDIKEYRGKQCKYCAIGLNLKVNEEYRKTTQQILEVCEAALEGGDCQHIGLNAGTFPPPGRGHEEHAELVAAIKSRFDVWVRFPMAPPEEEKYVDLLFEAGADQVGYNYEVFDPELYKEICPGKYEEINKGKGHQHYDRILSYSVKRGGPNKTFSILLTGIEPKESTVAGVEHLCKMGVVPRLSVFRPMPGTAFEHHPVSSVTDLVYIYRRLQEITTKYGVDSGCPGCGRTFVASKEYDGTNPAMLDITDEDLVRAGIDPASI